MINFETLFKKQKELDLEIARKHNITYKETRDRRTLSLLVELGELANSTRCFKYWSNKPSDINKVKEQEKFFGIQGFKGATAKANFDAMVETGTVKLSDALKAMIYPTVN